MCLIFLLNDLACFSFRSAAAAEPVQQSLQKNLNPHRGSGQADIDEGQIESGNKNGGYFFAQRVQSFCREPAMKWVTDAARARFLADFARSKAVPPEAGASMTSVTPSRRWPCKTAWTSRPSAVCSVTMTLDSHSAPTPTLRGRSRTKPHKRWAASWRK